MRRSLVVGVAVLVLGAGACGGSGGGGSGGGGPVASPGSGTGPGTGSAETEAGAPQLTLSFDGEGDVRSAVLSRNGGAVEMVPGAPGSGLAAAFPERCVAAAGCPRALVEIAPDPALAPGTGPFAYGASVWLAADQTTSGSNIVQQGRFGSPGGQWKLQVDDAAGRPSCVVRTSAGDAWVRSTTSVADGAWHRVVCRRDADGLSIEVDGTVHRSRRTTGAVGASAPIRVGSPGVGDDDDQFHGRVDDVFLHVAPEE